MKLLGKCQAHSILSGFIVRLWLLPAESCSCAWLGCAECNVCFLAEMVACTECHNELALVGLTAMLRKSHLTLIVAALEARLQDAIFKDDNYAYVAVTELLPLFVCACCTEESACCVLSVT